MEVGGKQSNVARLREGAGAIPPRTPPHNYEAEQALLGALLANNEVFNRVSEYLRPDHFADALHGRIYEAIGKLVLRGQIANPVTLKNLFDQDGALSEIGGGLEVPAIEYHTRAPERGERMRSNALEQRHGFVELSLAPSQFSEAHEPLPRHGRAARRELVGG